MRTHGTRAMYVTERCRCQPCRDAVAAYERQRQRRTTPAYIGADAARQHVRFLSEHGVGLKQIQKQSGVSQGALWKLMYGKDGKTSKRIRRETHDRILAVMPADRADGARVPASPVWEMVDTLLERGWTKAAISAAIGQGGRALQLGRDLVTARHARTIATLLDAPVPARQSRHGLHPVPQPEVEDDQVDTLPDDLPAPPSVDLLAQPWRRQAACRMPDVPVWIFFPGRGDAATVAAAKAVCERCASRVDCLETHLDEREGVWGGTTAAERRRIRKERRRNGDLVDDESEVA